MKRMLSFILAVFMLMSTLPSSGEAHGTEPELACVSDCCLSTCEKEETPCSEKKEQGCCADGICNPFTMCKVCFGYEVNNWDYTISPAETKNSFVDQTNTGIPDVYLSTCWQPPEMV